MTPYANRSILFKCWQLLSHCCQLCGGRGEDWHLFVIEREGLERAGSRSRRLSRINFNLLYQTQLWQIPETPREYFQQINVNLILKNKHKNKSKQGKNCLVMSQSQLEKQNSKNLQDFQLKNYPKQSINIQSWHPCCGSLFICDPKLTLNCDRYMCIYAIDTIALYPVLSSTIPSCPADRQRTLLFIDFVFAFASLTI